MTENDTDTETETPTDTEYDPEDDIVQFEEETSGVDAPGIADADELDALVDEYAGDASADFTEAQIGDPGRIEDTAEDARLDPQGIDIDLPDDLTETTPAEWDSTRRAELRETLTANHLPRGYHVRAFVNAVTGDIHEIVAAPSEGVVMGTPHVVSKRDDAGALVEPTLAPRERAVLYEARFDPDEFLTDGDLDEYEQAVRERHDERMTEMASIEDPMEMSPRPHEVYWAETAVEDRGPEE